jgi:hypothetical protein
MNLINATRPTAARARRRVPLAGALAVGAATMALLAGCAGLTAPNVAGNGGGPAGPAFTGDACSLITAADFAAAMGNSQQTASPEPGSASCSWTFTSPDNLIPDEAEVRVTSPGGKADFNLARQITGALGGGLNSFVAPIDTALASLGIGNLIGVQNLTGVGDDAFIGAAGTVYAIKGDTEVSLQLLAFDDPQAQQHAIDLVKKALARLP